MKRPVCKAETRTRVKTDGAKYKKKKKQIYKDSRCTRRKENEQTADYLLLNARRHSRQLHIDLRRNVWYKDA